jgi:hypothetical protein
MNRPLLALVLGLALLAPGCCSTRDTETGVSVDSYKQAITKIKSNLTESIRPALATALDEVGQEGKKPYIDAYKEGKLTLIDATVQLCDDTLTGKNAPDGEVPEEEIDAAPVDPEGNSQ